jgi:predicted acetyltransferase
MSILFDFDEMDYFYIEVEGHFIEATCAPVKDLVVPPRDFVNLDYIESTDLWSTIRSYRHSIREIVIAKADPPVIEISFLRPSPRQIGHALIDWHEVIYELYLLDDAAQRTLITMIRGFRSNNTVHNWKKDGF